MLIQFQRESKYVFVRGSDDSLHKPSRHPPNALPDPGETASYQEDDIHFQSPFQPCPTWFQLFHWFPRVM